LLQEEEGKIVESNGQLIHLDWFAHTYFGNNFSLLALSDGIFKI
jgi:hypothetical protein